MGTASKPETENREITTIRTENDEVSAKNQELVVIHGRFYEASKGIVLRVATNVEVGEELPP